MSPIRPENRALYPAEWRELSLSIRGGRARWRCECMGECGRDHDDTYTDAPRCGAIDGRDHPVTGSQVVLTVAHLDHDPRNSDMDNLRAMCQRCHLSYDAAHHASNAMRTRIARETVGMDPLPLAVS